MSPGCIPALIASTWVGVNGTAFLEKNEVTHIICEYMIKMFRHNRARVVGWKGRIFSAADVNCKIGLRHWPTNWSVPVLEKPGSCLVLFFYCLFAYPRDTIVRTRLNVSTRSRSNWNLKVLVFQERIKPEYQEKILSEQEWEPTTNSTHKINGVDAGKQTRTTLVGGECSHHWAILAPPPSSSPLLTFVSRSLGNASHAGYVFAVWKTTC